MTIFIGVGYIKHANYGKYPVFLFHRNLDGPKPEMQDNHCHTYTVEEALRKLDTSFEGLSPAEVKRRRERFGRNVLPRRRRVTLVEVILHQFLSPLIYVLMAAAIVSMFLGEFSDAGFIFLILLINAVIGASQEWNAEAKASALQEMIRIRVKIRREGSFSVEDSEELVPGDVVALESGNKVPADIRIIHENNLTVEEAVLTGESMAIRKTSEPLSRDEVPLAERSNMLFAGTTVTTGRVTGVVAATAEHTEIGKIASSLKDLHMGKAPLVERMEFFARKISLYVLVACAVLAVLGYLNGIGTKEIFFFVVAVAVSAIPEGLPIAMTVALSIGASRMAKRNVIIRRLTAVEGLGSCTFIGTDKTGTLTVDQQTIKAIVLPGATYAVTGEGYNGEGQILDSSGRAMRVTDSPGLEGLIRSAVISNEGYLKNRDGKWEYSGDPIDVAMLSLPFKGGTTPGGIFRSIEKVKDIPFESERRFALMYYRHNGRLMAAAKGAIEAIVDSEQGDELAAMLSEANKYALNGFRVIAVAGGEVDAVRSDESLPPLVFQGFVALIDPLRREAKPAILACRKAGVDVAMITGDHPSTALSIAREVGIATTEDELITGLELSDVAKKGDAEFMATLKIKRVFSRVTPQQKQQIVQALRDSGQFIAVTGDGVNDAPALRTANIGVAMGYGTDVAKDTSSIIVTDNNFASIVAGIEEGRFTYSNLRKIIYMLISTGAAELIMIGLSLVFQLPLPFLPLQLLWLNLVTNGIQDVALAFEKGEKSVMSQPPRRPDERVFDRLMIHQTLVSAGVISLLTFGLWYHLLNHLGWSETAARNTILLLMVLLQNFHVFNCRSETESAFRIPLRNNIFLLVGITAAQVIHIAAMHVPVMQDLLSLSPVSFENWIRLFLTASIIVGSMEIFKLIQRKRNRQSRGTEFQKS
jgi:magnesium-transporting ATPase (P-type)